MKTCFDTCISKKFLMNDEQLLHLLKFIPEKNKLGRPLSDPIAVLQGIFYLLKTGCQWNALPKCFGPSSTIHENFQRFARNNFFFRAWHHALEKYDRYVGLQLQKQSFDCNHTKSPLGGIKTGMSPVDRRKLGTKKAVLTDKNGIPLSISVMAGNTHDSKAIMHTLCNQVYSREVHFKTIELDAAFDASFVRKFLESIGYAYRISPNKRRGPTPENRKMQFRWSVERTHSWINRFRRLFVRWEKLPDNFLALLQFACQVIVFNKI